MAGGINNFSPMIGNNASQLMKNLQQLIAANPGFLTSGIPNHLIQQMWKKEPEPTNAMMQPKVNQVINKPNNNRFDVCVMSFYDLLSCFELETFWILN